MKLKQPEKWLKSFPAVFDTCGFHCTSAVIFLNEKEGVCVTKTDLNLGMSRTNTYDIYVKYPEYKYSTVECEQMWGKNWLQKVKNFLHSNETVNTGQQQTPTAEAAGQ